MPQKNANGPTVENLLFMYVQALVFLDLPDLYPQDLIEGANGFDLLYLSLWAPP